MKWTLLLVWTLVFLIIAPVTQGLLCYQCGTFLATTSVSPCTNLTREHLRICQHSHCSKYVGLANVVFGCEANCQEERHGSFDAYCCSEDGCNGVGRSLLCALLLVLNGVLHVN